MDTNIEKSNVSLLPLSLIMGTQIETVFFNSTFKDYVNKNTLQISLTGGIFHRPLDTLNSDNVGLC